MPPISVGGWRGLGLRNNHCVTSNFQPRYLLSQFPEERLFVLGRHQNENQLALLLVIDSQTVERCGRGKQWLVSGRHFHNVLKGNSPPKWPGTNNEGCRRDLVGGRKHRPHDEQSGKEQEQTGNDFPFNQEEIETAGQEG